MSRTPLPPTLSRKPKATTETIEDLVDRVRRGLVRVPAFQRGLKWKSLDVLDLFDSIYRGYPIGSLLLWQRAAEAGRVHIGPLMVVAPETSSAWWVVDGQQRLTALTASLARPEPIPSTPDDPYVVYFDPEDQRFCPPPRSGKIESTWVPLPLLLDATRLGEWMFEWTHGRNSELRKTVFEAGRRLREYPVPLYIVDTDDEALLKEIFFRVNNSGRRLKWPEVHDALVGGGGKSPSRLNELGTELAPLGMGKPSNQELLQCLLASRGLDITVSLAEHRRRNPSVLNDAVPEALPVLRRVLSFLRQDAEVVHLRLLPHAIPMIVLTRFFFLHPEPVPRTRELLTRWTWRSFLGAERNAVVSLARRGVQRIQADDEEASVQALLDLLPRQQTEGFVMPRSFSARSADSRVVLLALTSLDPRSLDEETLIDVPELIAKGNAGAFRTIVDPRGNAHPLTHSPANRMLYPGGDRRSTRKALLERIENKGIHDPVLVSHAITPEAAAFLTEDRVEQFLEARSQFIVDTVNALGDRLAGWSRSDRPSIEYLLQQTGTEP